MQIRSFHKVEFLLPGEDIPEAVRIFNDLLGGHLPDPIEVEGQGVLSATDYALGLEIYGPKDADSPRAGVFDSKPRRGAIGPIVWEVDDLDAAKAQAVERGFRVVFEFGEKGERQVHFDPAQLAGYGLTFTERPSKPRGRLPTIARRFQRIELMMTKEELDPAREAFARFLGSDFPTPSHYKGVDVLSSVNWKVGIELTAPAGPESVIAGRVAERGHGSIGPIVWEVDDLDSAKATVLGKGYRVVYEFGELGQRQIHMDPTQLFGFGVTFTERHTSELGAVDREATSGRSRTFGGTLGPAHLPARVDRPGRRPHWTDVVSGEAWPAARPG
jgi:hypothetical protein